MQFLKSRMTTSQLPTLWLALALPALVASSNLSGMEGAGQLSTPKEVTGISEVEHEHAVLRELYAVEPVPNWDWPPGSVLRIGDVDADIAFHEAELRAAMSYSSFAIQLPSLPCSVLVTEGASTLPIYHVVGHIHDQPTFEALIEVKANSSAYIFLGPSLGVGYELSLDKWLPDKNGYQCTVQRLGGISYTYDISLLDSGQTTKTFWIAYTMLAGEAELRFGSGTSFGASQLFYFSDPAPPHAALETLDLWVATVGNVQGEWKVCLQGSSRAIFDSVNHPAPAVKVVQPSATRNDCFHEYWDVPLQETQNGATLAMGGEASIWPLSLTLSENSLSSTGTVFKFMHGGRYKLCYKPDATNACMCSGGTCECTVQSMECTPSSRVHGSCNPFADATTMHRNNLLFADLVVLGVSSPCQTDDCLIDERWDCYFGQFGDGAGPCRFDFAPGSGRVGWTVTPGAVSRMQWTDAWAPDVFLDGFRQSSNPRACAEDGNQAPQFETYIPFTFDLFPETQGIVSMPPVERTVSEPFTVTVCYCPDVTTSQQHGTCASYQDYIQSFGRLYMWTIRICDYDNYQVCPYPYLRVLPQQQFVLKVKCPPGGACMHTTTNRIKYLDVSKRQARPNWDAGNICKSRPIESVRAVWPLEEDSLNLHGGSRSDYKAWVNKQVILDHTTNEAFEVCYCNDACSNLLNWIQVGRMRTSAAFAYAYVTQGTSTGGEIKTVEFVNKPGSFTLYGGIFSDIQQALPSPYDSNQFSGNALLSVLSFDRERRDGLTLEERYGFNVNGRESLQSAMDAECQQERVSPGLIDTVTIFPDMIRYMGWVSTATRTATDRYMPFAGPEKDRTMTVLQASTLAICYCARVTDGGSCLAEKHWMFAGVLQIRGPRGGQLWLLPTKTVVRIEDLEGWGFRSTDRLRLLESSASCSENDWTPLGSTTYQVGCPSGSPSATQPCRFAETEENLVMDLADSISTGISLEGIHVESAQSSILSFSGPITDHVREGDAINIRRESIVIDSHSVDTMTEAQRYDASTLAAEFPFADRPSQSYLGYWLRVHYIDGRTDGSVNSQGRVSTKLRIPLGWSEDHPGGIPKFSFSAAPPEQAQWVRANVAHTKIELKAAEAQQNLKVCWGPLDNGLQRFYAEAGQLTFADPPLMRSAELSFTARSSDTTAPAIISFTVNRRTIGYLQSTGEMILTIRFLDVQKVTFAAMGPRSVLPETSLSVSEMSQADCGNIFSELWSNDPRGFPVPRGCFFSAVGSTGEPGEREVSIVFERFSGIRNTCVSERGYCEYQLVLHLVVSSLARDDKLLDLYAGCRYEGGGCNHQFEIYEKAEPSHGMVTLAPAQAGINARLSGVYILEGDGNGVRELSATHTDLEVRLRAEGSPGIQRSALLRLFLMPLTQWSAGPEDCQVQCAASNSTRCDGPIECLKKQLITTSDEESKYNILQLRLPQDMEPIEGAVAHAFHISALTAPGAAIFPTRLGAQISTEDDEAPHYVMTDGYVSFLGPGSPRTDGRLLVTGRSGSGPQPFEANNNSLYMRLQFAATLWGGIPSSNAVTSESYRAFLEVSLPYGYSCHVSDNGVVTHPFDDIDTIQGYKLDSTREAPFDNEAPSIFLLDRNLDGHADHPRGTLEVSGATGSWELSSGNTCVYGIRPGQALYAGQVIYVELGVTNPAKPLKRSATDNVWSTRLLGLGALTQGDMYTTEQAPFISLEQEKALVSDGQADLWVGSVSVLAPLDNVLVQPASFATGAVHFLSIFFSPQQDVMAGGHIMVDAPSAFEFGSVCIAHDLDAVYYEVTEAGTRLLPLANRGDCVGSRSPDSAPGSTNRARIKVHSRFAAGSTYGFQLKVQNPAHSSGSCSGDWYLWTLDFNGFLVDGAKEPAAFARNQQGSWCLYHSHLPTMPSLVVEGGSLRPYHVFKQLEVLVVNNIQVPGSGEVQTSLRVTAPPGCEFQDPSTSNFELATNSSSLPLPYAPLVRDPGQLLWTSFTLKAGEVYGFRAFFLVLVLPLRAAVNSFFFELGFSASVFEDRLGAIAVKAPALRKITGAHLGYISSRIGYKRNVLTFEFRIASEVPPFSDSAIVIQGSEGLQGSTLNCQASYVEGHSTPLPADVICKADVDSSGLPYLQLLPGALPIQAGFYAIEVQSSNPVAALGTLSNWTINTLAGLSQSTLQRPIDAPTKARGFPMRSAMAYAVLVGGKGVDDRPGRQNQVVLAFRLSPPTEPQLAESTLSVHAPRGFVFDENCLSTLETSISGSEYGMQFDIWPQEPTACVGLGNAAHLTVHDLFVEGSYAEQALYALRLRVINPMVPPPLNYWTLEHDFQASEALPGFPLATVISLAPLQAVNMALNVGTGISAPVTATFKLQHAVPGGGRLQLSAPQGFLLHSATDLRPRISSSAIDFTSSKQGADLLVELADSSQMAAHLPYTMQVIVTNPHENVFVDANQAASWGLATFNATGGPLDDGPLAGFALTPLATLKVVNVGDRYYSVVPVQISVEIASSTAVLFGDSVRLQAPVGLALVAKSPLCSGFSWLEWMSSAPLPEAKCECAFGPCVVSMSFEADWKIARPLGGVALPANAFVSFELSSVNPPISPSLEDSFWRLTHSRNVGGSESLLSSAVQLSWEVLPQLQNVVVQLVGSSQAAGAESNLLLTFVPVSNAEVAWLIAEFPREISFDKAAVEAPRQKEASSVGANLVISHFTMVAATETALLIYSVKLGRGGGLTVFSLTTYLDTELIKKVDERLHFTGFHQAGRATLQGVLDNMYTTDPELYPVRSMLSPRGGEEAKATFEISVSYMVIPGDRLIISCEGSGKYVLLSDDRLSVKRFDRSGLMREHLEYAVQPSSEHRVDIALAGDEDVILKPSARVEAIIWTVPTLGINNWRVETRRGDVLTNTNDGEAAGFLPVAQLVVLLQAKRSPPQTLIEVQLHVSAPEGVDAAVSPELHVIAPPGFIFPEVCGDICAARGGTFGDTGRDEAVLTSVTSATLLEQNLLIYTKTPVRTPSELTWLVEARGLASQVVGWGSLDGFKVNQMRDTLVHYGGIAGLQVAQLAFTFRFSEAAEDRFFSTIDVIGPSTYIMSCIGVDLQQVSLPGGPPVCDYDGYGQLRLSLNETLTTGLYAFAVKLILPDELPEENYFALIIRERATDAVIDAAFELPGVSFAVLQMTQPSLAWSTAGMGGVSTVTVGFTFTNHTFKVQMLLIYLPSGFKQIVHRASDVKSSNAMLPLLKGGQDWVDSSHTQRLRILLESADPELAAGSYRLTFPVMLPETAASVPRWNLWQLSFCSDRSCYEPNHPSALVTFPMVGFEPGERSTLEDKRVQAALDTLGTSRVADGTCSGAELHWAALLLLHSAWLMRCTTVYCS